MIIAKGGHGGRGNAQFATLDQSRATAVAAGLQGEEKDLRLQLKLLADVGLVGFPNAGKSTLISRISAAQPKIADYPFTTLTPISAWWVCRAIARFVVADVPGLIEGAHTRPGPGHRFLRHLERTKVLVHLVDVSATTGRDPVEDFEVITRELELFPGRDAAGERLADKPVWSRRTRSTRSTIPTSDAPGGAFAVGRRSALPCVSGHRTGSRCAPRSHVARGRARACSRQPHAGRVRGRPSGLNDFGHPHRYPGRHVRSGAHGSRRHGPGRAARARPRSRARSCPRARRRTAPRRQRRRASTALPWLHWRSRACRD